MDETNFMQTVCWQTRPLAISNQARGKRHSAGRIFSADIRQKDFGG